MGSLSKVVLFTVLTIALAIIFQRNLMRLGAPGQFDDFQSDAEEMVRNRLLAAKRSGIFSDGGFLLETDDHGQLVPYQSRTGVQAQLLAWAFLKSGLDLGRFTSLSRFAMDLCLAATLLLFCVIVRREWGTLAAVIVFVLLLFSNWIVFFSGSLYWVIWTHLLPMILCFYMYPNVTAGTLSRKAFFSAIAFLVFVKSLGGYEYATNVLLSCAAPVLYYDILKGRNPRTMLSMMLRVTLAGSAGLAIAIAVHTVQAALYNGSLALALNHFWQRAEVRSFANPSIKYGVAIKIARNVYRYLGVDLLTLVRMGGQFRIQVPMYALNLALAFCGTVALADSRFIPPIARERRRLLAAIATCLWGLICSLTWFFIAVDHTYGHLHMDPIMFYVPYGLLVYFALAGALSLILPYPVAVVGTLLQRKDHHPEGLGSAVAHVS